MAGRTGMIFKFGAMLAVALAAAGAGYYYAVYLPRRDAALANERMLAKARADADARAAQARLAAQQLAQAERQALQKAAAEQRYQTCLNAAAAAHDASWADDCKSLAGKVAADHADCLDKLKLPKTYCDSSYPPRDGSPNCTLPGAIGNVLDADLARARDRCLQESKAAAP